MFAYNVYERVTYSTGERRWRWDYVGTVEAEDEQSALREAKERFKIDKGGDPWRLRNTDNFKVFDL